MLISVRVKIYVVGCVNMSDLNVYSGRDLQNTVSVLTQLKADGVVDTRSAIDVLQAYIDDTYKVKGVGFKKASRPKCPSCGSFNWHLKKHLAGVVYDGCGDCYFSRPCEVT
jgi:predicted  nucleic acid-binding Zn ribbon protein